jgi:hypothetical protein
MKTFKDKKGREWDTELDLLTCRRIDASDFKAYFKEPFSILDLKKEVLRDIVLKSPFTFAVIWAIVQPQAKEMHKAGTFPIDPDTDPEAAELEFVSGINAKAKLDGQQAFLESIGDFFPELKTVLSTLDRQLRNLSNKISQSVLETEPLLETLLNEDMDLAVSQIRERLKKTQGERVGEMLQSSQLLPAGH